MLTVPILIYVLHVPVKEAIAMSLGVEGIRFQEQALTDEITCHIGLGQRRPLVRRIGLIADQRQRAREPFRA